MADPRFVAATVVAVAAPVVAATLAALSWRRNTTGAREFAVLMALDAVWSATYVWSIFAAGSATLAPFRLSQSLIVLIPPVWVVFAATFAGYGDEVTLRRVAALSAVPAAMAVTTFVAPERLGVWSNPRTVEWAGLSLAAIDFGPLYWVSTAYAYGLIALGYAVLGRMLVRSVHVYRRQVLVLMLAGVPPTVGNLLYLTGNGPVQSLDLTPFAFVLQGVVIYWALFRYDLLELSPIARSAVLDDISDGVVVIDDDGRVVDVNAAARRLVDAESPVGEPLSKVFPELRDAILDGDGSAVAADGPAAEGPEEVRVEVDGSERYLDPDPTVIDDPRGEPLGLAVVLRDVTERRERERVFRELQTAARDLMHCETHEEVARRAIDASERILPVPHATVWLYDRETDRLEPAASTDEVADLYDPVPAFEAGEGLVGEVYARGEPRVFEDVHGPDSPDLLDPDTPVSSAMLLPLGDHGLFGVAATERLDPDTEEVQFTRLLAATVRSALARAEREGELAAKNERLETFASVVSHDLRSPLAVARARLEGIRREVDGDPEAVEKLADSLDRMDRLTEDLLTLTQRGGDVDPEPTHFRSVVYDAWGTVVTGDLSLDLDDEGVVIRADRGRLRELLENLFGNVVDHGSTSSGTPADDVVENATLGGGNTTASDGSEGDDDGSGSGGASTVRVATVTDDDGSFAGFAVADDGPGIPPADREKVLEHGYTTREGGTGLGLAIVERIAEGHGWTVTVTESESGGARFEFTGVELADRSGEVGDEGA